MLKKDQWCECSDRLDASATGFCFIVSRSKALLAKAPVTCFPCLGRWIRSSIFLTPCAHKPLGESGTACLGADWHDQAFIDSQFAMRTVCVHATGLIWAAHALPASSASLYSGKLEAKPQTSRPEKGTRYILNQCLLEFALQSKSARPM